jgi:hypothetical protein
MRQQQLKMLIDVERELLPLGTLNLLRQYSHYLQVAPPKELNKEVQTGIRISDKKWKAAKQARIKHWYEDTAEENTMPLVQPIWPVWYDSDPASWPEELRNFWYRMDISYTDKRGAIVQSIRTYYPEDEKLLECANFIEYWTGKNLQITYDTKYSVFNWWQDSLLLVLGGITGGFIGVVLPYILIGRRE